MKRLIIPLIFFILIGTVSAEGYLTPLVYELEISNTEGDLNVENVSLANSAMDSAVPEEGYEIRLVTRRGKLLARKKFRFPNRIMFSPPLECYDEETGEISEEICPEFSAKEDVLEESHVTVRVPYRERGENFLVYDPEGDRVLSYDVSGFSNYCGNGRCDQGEYHFTCPEECDSGIEDYFCDGEKDGICDPDCETNEDPDCEQPSVVSDSTWIVFLSLVIVIIFLLTIIAVLVFFRTT